MGSERGEAAGICEIVLIKRNDHNRFAGCENEGIVKIEIHTSANSPVRHVHRCSGRIVDFDEFQIIRRDVLVLGHCRG